MHIPDGYLGPLTCGVSFAVMIPLWSIAAKKAQQTLQAKQVPLLAMSAAFSFVIMMFNIPIPGGSTGHAVGAVLSSLLIGPWAACIAVSVALVIQALLFGDGGITAIAANCFNIAFVMSFVGFWVYRLICGSCSIHAKKRVLAAGIAGYCGLVMASLTTSLMFGIQPILHTTNSGQALYCPYGLKVAVSVMVSEHALIFGWIEFIITALVIRFIQSQNSELLYDHGAEKT